MTGTHTAHPMQSPPAPPSLIIFDCDGVLVDSERISHLVLQAMLAEHGVTMSYEDSLRQFLGTSMSHCMAIVEQLTQVPASVFLPRFRARTYEAFAAQLEPVAGVRELLQSLSVPSCVASNGPHDKMALTLACTGLDKHFEGAVFSADDVAHPKPAPDLFLHAAAAMSVRPEHCVVIEDSPTGVRAARAAGMHVFGYAAMTPAQRLRDAGAHGVFDAMPALPSLLGLVPAGT